MLDIDGEDSSGVNELDNGPSPLQDGNVDENTTASNLITDSKSDTGDDSAIGTELEELDAEGVPHTLESIPTEVLSLFPSFHQIIVDFKLIETIPYQIDMSC